ncbi:MAG: lysophospholipase [Candidatus Obscuribacterales bacterium]|nr:lysophospholipase [Candidatus Obscuribacterales bacterium]
MISRNFLLLAALSLGLLCQPVLAADSLEGLRIAQLMQMERHDVAPLEALDAAGKKPADAKAQAIMDVTPVISWVDPAVKLKAVLVCVHGLGLHKENYKELGERIAKDGYAVYSMDVRGFGEFQQLPGDRKVDFKKCLDDVCDGLKMARAMHPGVPVFVLGESMGGAIAMRVTEEHPELVDGLISSVPGAKRNGNGKSIMQVGMKLITGGANAKVNVADTVVNRSTNKQELRDEWANDKLARFVLTPIELIQFQHFMESNEKNASKITNTPVLMVQGNEDQLVKHDDNESILNHIASKDKVLVFVVSGEHLIFEEGQFNDDTIKLLTGWIDDHSKATAQVSDASSSKSESVK